MGADRYVLVALLIVAAPLVFFIFQESDPPTPRAPPSSSSARKPTPKPTLNTNRVDNKTLVVYVYNEAQDGVPKANLEFFLALGVDEREDVDYAFVLQGPCPVTFPEWRNLVVLRKENDCYDFGGWRYALDHIPWREKAYRYFIFLNSSLRGPFVPLYVPPSIHWTTLFTQLLKHDGDGFTSTNNGPIKLVGLTITCYANRTHVQSMFWATDYEALEHLLDSTNVLNCKNSPEEAIHGGEIKLSASILERGWNIASLSTATRGWDFRNATFTCNSETIPDPTSKGGYYGISTAVHETLFVRANGNARLLDIDLYSEFTLQAVHNGKFDGLRFNLLHTNN